MFFHLYKYRIISLLKEKTIMFWSIAFPLLLGTLFFVAFGGITDSTEAYDTIPVALVENKENAQFTEVLGSVEFSENVPMFEVIPATYEEAAALLKNDSVSGIIIVDDEIILRVNKEGLNQTVLEQFTEQYERQVALITDIYMTNSGALEDVIKVLSEESAEVKTVSLSGADSDPLVYYFYALIGLACLYGSFIGLQLANDLQPYQSALAARRCVTPTHHLKILLSDTLAALTLHFAELMIVWFYLRVILRIEIGRQPGYFMLACLLGSLIGITIGQFNGTVLRKKPGLQIAVSLGFSMISSMLSGLMAVDMKYAIDKACPIINRLNPASLITDAFYCLSTFDDYSRYLTDIATLGVIAVILIMATFLSSRKSRYKSL